ncbi:hypothetical protein DEO72_LG5g1596 [Vigna unguiculata]|uniref:Uncharacterized protein n=1 Tax=Vigna unguiculata TaxID=3917 RepID=A0A4D6LYT8_VIGUN|nr:hypothetical protein DEO72_LG5g1596 [Vigna unguiculata]
MTIINVAPIPAGQGRRRRRRPPLTGDTLPFFLLQRSHSRRDTPPSTPVTTERIANENPTPRIVSLLVSSPAREIRQILELRRRTPRRFGLAFASLDHRKRDCRHGAVTACREHYRREHVSLLKAPTRRRPLFSVFTFGMGWCCDVEVVFYEWECCGIGLGCCGIGMENESKVKVRM